MILDHPITWGVALLMAGVMFATRELDRLPTLDIMKLMNASFFMRAGVALITWGAIVRAARAFA